MHECSLLDSGSNVHSIHVSYLLSYPFLHLVHVFSYHFVRDSDRLNPVNPIPSWPSIALQALLVIDSLRNHVEEVIYAFLAFLVLLLISWNGMAAGKKEVSMCIVKSGYLGLVLVSVAYRWCL